jgi:hypothetical protein
MPLNFPTAPTKGQVYDQWQWDGVKWVAVVGVLPAGPAGAQGPPGQPGLGRGRVFYYNPTNDANVPGYKRMLTAPSTNPEKTIATVCNGVNVDFLVGTFITDPGVPGVLEYPAGTAFRRIYVHLNSGTARFHWQIYIRDLAGAERLALDEFSPEFSNQTVAIVEWITTSAALGKMLATDRLVNKLSVQRITGGGGTITVTTHFEGSTAASQIQTTILPPSVAFQELTARVAALEARLPPEAR